MATRSDISAYYDTFGVLHRLRMKDMQGDFPDYTCAYFSGDNSKSYTTAQRDKYAWIFEGLGLGSDLSGKRVLDIGCGWGPILNAVRVHGGTAVGLTLSADQTRHCRAHGLNVLLQDYKDLKHGELGVFDGIVSIGAFEHFCSIGEMLGSDQEAIYREFFHRCANRLPGGGRLFLQTMTWGDNVPDYRKLSLDAPPDSREAILARMEYMYPGSWLPNGLSQIVECARPYFEIEEASNGRLDYLETLKHWEAATDTLWSPMMLPRTLWHLVPIGLRLLWSQAARIQWQAIARSDQRVCFEQNIMSHERIFFRKR